MVWLHVCVVLRTVLWYSVAGCCKCAQIAAAAQTLDVRRSDAVDDCPGVAAHKKCTRCRGDTSFMISCAHMPARAQCGTLTIESTRRAVEAHVYMHVLLCALVYCMH